MEKINIPPLYCSLPPVANRYAEVAQKHTMQWACDNRIIPPDSNLTKVVDGEKSAWLAAFTWPYIEELSDLKLLADLNTYLFCNDDSIYWNNEKESNYSLEQLFSAKKRSFSILEGDKVTSKDGPLEHALYDIYRRVSERTNQFWLHRFSCSMHKYLKTNIWEAINLQEKTIPSFATYKAMRPFGGGAYPAFDLAFLISDIDPKCEFLNNNYLDPLAVMANSHICWVNDIVSFKKERLEEGSTNNLLFILQEEKKISLQEAVNFAVLLINKEMEAFFEMKNIMASFFAKGDPALQVYVDILENWINGHMYWNDETERYGGVQISKIYKDKF